MSEIRYYRLAEDRRTAIRCDLLVWADQPIAGPILADTTLPDGRRVRTMFHGMCDDVGGAYLCGTAIMGAAIREIGQYNNVPAAMRGHEQVVTMLLNDRDTKVEYLVDNTMPEDVKADVAEPVDAVVSKTTDREVVRVRVPPSAPTC